MIQNPSTEINLCTQDTNVKILGCTKCDQIRQRTLTVGGRITVHLVSSLTRLDLTEDEKMFFVCPEAAESKLLKLETIHTVKLP